MKKFSIGLLAVITFVPAFMYLVSCLTPYISPVYFWPMAFLALAVPYLAVVVLVLGFFWIFIRRKVAGFLFLLIFVGFQNLFATFALNPRPKSSLTKEPNSIRVLTWNVRNFDNPAIAADSANSIRRKMFNYISATNPDVLCLQEFAEYYVPGTLSNTSELKKLGYVYCNKTNEITHSFSYGEVLSGSAIFSKIPIINAGTVMLGDSSYREYLAFADVSLQGKTVRVFSTHLKSINLFANPADTANRVIFYGDSSFVYQSTKFEKLKAFARAHAKEAIIAKQAINKSPFPVIVGTDMNSVPTSYPYHILSTGLQDVFRLNGWGLGTTLANLPKTLRIDFLLVDKRLSIDNFRKDELHLSDHFPQFVDAKWKDN